MDNSWVSLCEAELQKYEARCRAVQGRKILSTGDPVISVGDLEKMARGVLINNGAEPTTQNVRQAMGELVIGMQMYDCAARARNEQIFNSSKEPKCQ